MSVVIETTIGSLTVDLHCDLRPRTCLNFLKLCKMKYYNFCPFHRITKDFIAQSGEQIYDGQIGGQSVFGFLYGENGRYFEPEPKVKLKHDRFGTLSMVTSEAKLCGSQFFLTLSDSLDYLDDVHTVFGRVVDGFDVLHDLNQLLCDQDDKPYRDVLITHTVILHDPFDDPAQLECPESPLPSEQLLTSDTIFIRDGYDENDGKTAEEIDEEMKDKDAKAKAIVLEMIGDLPDADVAPPDNVLFICKLNPVTRTEDLQVIFSRFGKILECEVIRDQKSGESLQYAFIEFEKPEDCEQAYFKMDNVLIDDRRIHVDFSQSVAKFKWNRKTNEKKERTQNGSSSPDLGEKSTKRERGWRDHPRHFQEGKGEHLASKSHPYKSSKRNRSRSPLRYRSPDRSGRSTERKRRSRSSSQDRQKRSKSSHDKHLLKRNDRYDRHGRNRSRSKERLHKNHSRSNNRRHRSKSPSHSRSKRY